MRKDSPIDLSLKKTWGLGRVIALLCLWIITHNPYWTSTFPTMFPSMTALLGLSLPRPWTGSFSCASWTDSTCFSGGEGRKEEIRRERHSTRIRGFKEANLGYLFPPRQDKYYQLPSIQIQLPMTGDQSFSDSLCSVITRVYTTILKHSLQTNFQWEVFWRTGE